MQVEWLMTCDPNPRVNPMTPPSFETWALFWISQALHLSCVHRPIPLVSWIARTGRADAETGYLM